MAHMGARVFVTFDDRYVNIHMGPSAQKHSIDDFNGDNFDHRAWASSGERRSPSLLPQPRPARSEQPTA